jgi:chromosome partitioning protein
LGNGAEAYDEPVIDEVVEAPAILPVMAALTPIQYDGASFLRAPAQR